MAIIIHEPIEHLEAGSYTGTIQQIQDFSNKGYLVFLLCVNEKLLNVAVSLSSRVLWEFAKDFTDQQGAFDDAAVIGKTVEFTLADKQTANGLRSKITALRVVG